LSALTKILIVLLTLSSIFLCGIVVTYVAGADNYKELYERERAEKQAAVARKNSANELLDNEKKKYQTHADDLREQIASLSTQLVELKNELTDVRREKTDLEKRVQSWVSMTDTLTKTTEKQSQQLEDTLTELKQVKADQIKERLQLKELTDELIKREAIIQTLTADKKRLEEKNYKLQGDLDQLLRRVGKETAPPPVVTSQKPPAPKVPTVAPSVKPIGLKALITAVDLKNSVAEISIGTAHGIREGMRFYVTRADKFICEILIFSVDTERAVGILERVRYQPKAGDKVATNL
jgi:hypothetical protein